MENQEQYSESPTQYFAGKYDKTYVVESFNLNMR